MLRNSSKLDEFDIFCCSPSASSVLWGGNEIDLGNANQ